MNAQIDYISIEDSLWIQFREGLISFSHNGLPSDVHFTISFDPRSENINFHITRNVSNSFDKPKITIACIHKELFQELHNPLATAMFHKLFVPLDIRFWCGKYGKDLYYCSFNEFEKDKRKQELEEKMISGFKEISRIKKRTKLKIKGATEEKVTAMIASSKMKNLILVNLRRIPRKFTSPTDAGYLVTKKQILLFLREGDNWYQINQGVKPVELLMAGVDPEISAELITKFNESLPIVKIANSYRDTEPYDNPIILTRL